MLLTFLLSLQCGPRAQRASLHPSHFQLATAASFAAGSFAISFSQQKPSACPDPPQPPGIESSPGKSGRPSSQNGFPIFGILVHLVLIASTVIRCFKNITLYLIHLSVVIAVGVGGL